MKINETTIKDDYLMCPGAFRLKVNGEEKLFVRNLSECPEDAYLHRDLNFVYSISNLMKLAWEAGKKGETFEVISNEISEEEDEEDN